MPRKAKSISERFWDKVDTSGDCWLWTANRLRGRDGTKRYGLIGGSRRGGGTFYAHRVSWEIHNGPIPEGANVCHHCDSPACVKPDHLFLGSQKQNVQDMDRKGRRGSVGPQAGTTGKLSKKEVLSLMDMYSQGYKQDQLAKVFGVSRATVSNYLTGRTALPNY